MEKKLRTVRLDHDPKENIDFIAGRVCGVMAVGSNTEPDKERQIEFEDTNDGGRTRWISCDATDEEWENIKRNLFWSAIYRRVLTVVKE